MKILIRINLRISEFHLFYNLQVFYWHFLEILCFFIFLVLYFSYSISPAVNFYFLLHYRWANRRKEKKLEYWGWALTYRSSNLPILTLDFLELLLEPWTRCYENMSKGSKFQDYLSHYQPLPRIEFLKGRGWRGQSLQDPTVGLYFTGGWVQDPEHHSRFLG